MKHIFRQLIHFFLTIVLTSLFCLGMYQWNNKYTYDTIQPNHGQLVVTEEYLQNFHYLIDDWEFYPDILLTPENLKEQTTSAYMVYTNIGDYTRFDGLGSRKSPYGCGTYVLHLWLPNKVHSYALELPEIYSSYKLYLNGTLYAQVGNPEIDYYIPRTQTRFITFEAAGQIDILIAVSNYSHFYSGIVYPPIFGLSSKVISMREIRLGIIAATSTIGLILSLFSIYFGLRLKRHIALLFALLCLIMCLTPAFPLLHTLIELPIYPWYTLEIISIYLMMLLVIILHNCICNTNFLFRYLSIGIAGAVCLFAGLYGSFAPFLTVPVMRMFSTLISFFKLGTAAYLLLTASFSLCIQKEPIQPLYYASIAYAVIFIWDRILPDFEPIFYGWFSDWGSLLLILAIGYTLWRDLATTYTHHLVFVEEHRQMTKQLAIQTEYFRCLTTQSEENRKLIHDFRHHLHTISSLTQQIKSTQETINYQEKLLSYLEQISHHNFSSVNNICKTFSSNTAVDALLQYYYSTALEKKISTDFRLLLPSSLALTDIELCTILGNLLENAVDACNRLSENQERHLAIFSQQTEQLWFLLIENTYDGVVLKQNHQFLSRKNNGVRSGIGIESVREIVKKHGGTVDIYPQKQQFRVGITLPLNKIS